MLCGTGSYYCYVSLKRTSETSIFARNQWLSLIAGTYIQFVTLFYLQYWSSNESLVLPKIKGQFIKLNQVKTKGTQTSIQQFAFCVFT
jgi:hypothetical protein